MRLGLNKRPLVWPVVGALALLLSACGSSAASSTAQTPTTLAVALTPQDSLNWWPPVTPVSACGRPTEGGVTGPDMYMPLVWVNREDAISYTHSIAENIAVSNNFTRYTITLNPKWHWSNGQPVTAQDVVYDWDLLDGASQAKAPLAYCYVGSGGFPTDWASVTAPSAHTVVVTTTKSVNPTWFEHNGLTQLVPIPVKTWDKYSNVDQELSWINSIGNSPTNPVYRVVDGPYTIVKAVHNDYWTYQANPHYDGRRPAIKTIVYYYEASSAATFAALKRGTLQEAPLPFSLEKELSTLSGYRTVAEPSYGFYYIQLNFRSNAQSVGGLFNNLYVRQALQMGIDQPGIVSAIYGGKATVTNGPVPIAPHNQYYDYSQPVAYPYSPAKGKALLEKHGWRLVNGVMTKGSQTLAFNFDYIAGTTSAQIAQLIAQAWQHEGIKVTLVSQNATTLYDIIGNAADSNKWSVAGGADFGWLYIPDFYPSGGSLFASSAGFNLGAYDSAEMNSLIAATYQGGTRAQVTQRFDAYQLYAADQLPVLYQPTPESLTVVSTSLKGYAAGYNAVEAYVPDNRLSFNS